MSRYVSPVNPSAFPTLSIVLLGKTNTSHKQSIGNLSLGIGIFLMAWFFVYEVTSTKYTRDWKKELLIALYNRFFDQFEIILWDFRLVWLRFSSVMAVCFFYFGLEFMFEYATQERMTLIKTQFQFSSITLVDFFLLLLLFWACSSLDFPRKKNNLSSCWQNFLWILDWKITEFICVCFFMYLFNQLYIFNRKVCTFPGGSLVQRSCIERRVEITR